MSIEQTHQREINVQELMIETISCLTKTFKSVNKEEREAAERRLRELEKNLLVHFKVIIEALKGGQDQSIISSKKIKSKII